MVLPDQNDMTIHLLDCPDCRTELRIRDLTNPVPLHCPRCGEALDTRQARPRPPREKKKTQLPAASVRTENDSGKAKPGKSGEKQVARAKRGLQMGPLAAVAIVLCAGGAVTAAMYFGIRLALRPTIGDLPTAFHPSPNTTAQNPGSRISQDWQRQVQQQMDSMQQALRNPGTGPASPGLATAPAVPDTRPALPAASNAARRLTDIREKMQADLEQARSRFRGPPSAGGPPSFGGPPSAGGPPAPGFGVPRGFGPPPGFGAPATPPAPSSPNPSGNPAVPNLPAVNDEEQTRKLLQEIKSSNGNPAALVPLVQLPLRPVIPGLRSEVLDTVRPLLAAENPIIRSTAAETFAIWADQEQLAELQRLATSTDPLYTATRRRALKTLIAMQPAELNPAVVSSLDDFQFSYDIQKALATLGPAAEKPVLQAWPNVTTGPGKRALIEVLGEVGSAASLQFLEPLATSTDTEVRIPAVLAIDKIRSRR